MVKKAGFTLVELLIVFSIIGIIASIMLMTIKPQNYHDKEAYMKATKMIGVFEKASVQIRDLEHEQCPTSSFMSKLPGSTYEFSLVNESGSKATSEDVVNLFGKYLMFGLVFLLIFQTILNLCVVVGLVPVTGVTLPFISYGGSSLVVSMICIGIILNVCEK